MGTAELDPLRAMLLDAGILLEMFDVVRLVNAEDGRMLEAVDGEIRETDVCCTNVFGTDERCRNCTSIRSFYSGEQVVKLEYVGGAVLLIVSVPLAQGEKRFVAELVKDITKSMTVDIRDADRSGEVSGMIDNLNRIAVTDPLTGLYNRRYIDDKLPASLQNCRSLSLPLSVAMVDIDHFKIVNDTYGHQAGDDVLKDVAGILKSFIRRRSDFAARYGGEEFMLCFPGVELGDCRTICGRIREKVERTVMERGGANIRVTVSIGIAESGEAPAIAELISLADRRLYEAKGAGRNRVMG